MEKKFMGKFMKGNFTPKNEVTASNSEAPETLEARFERQALKRLGGSIAFVRKQRVHWGDGEVSETAETAETAKDDKPNDAT